MNALLETGHDAVVGGDAVAVVLGLEGLHKDIFSVKVLEDHDVLVFTERSDRKVSHAIGIEIFMLSTLMWIFFDEVFVSGL